MTGNFWIDNAISAAGIAFVVFVVFIAFRKKSEPLTRERACARIAFDEPDFEATEWLIDEHANAALAMNGKGEFVLARGMGDDVLTRRFRAGDAIVAQENGRLIIKLRDISVPAIGMTVGERAEPWARLLSTLRDKGA